MNNCGVKIDEDGDEVCHCCQPPHYKIVSTEPWCVCDDNGNHHGYTGLNGVFVCCPAPPEGRPQPIRVGYECGQGCTGCCPNGTIYNIGEDEKGYPIEGCCEEPNKALPFSCCASGKEPVQNIDIYGNRIMRQMYACCPEGTATQAINGQCCSGEVYQNANSGNYECCPEGSTVSNGICCEANEISHQWTSISGTVNNTCCPDGYLHCFGACYHPDTWGKGRNLICCASDLVCFGDKNDPETCQYRTEEYCYSWWDYETGEEYEECWTEDLACCVNINGEDRYCTNRD